MNMAGFRGQTVAKQEALILAAHKQLDPESEKVSHKIKHAEFGFASPVSCLYSVFLQICPSSSSVLQTSFPTCCRFDISIWSILGCEQYAVEIR
jgi:E3 ubiquitin-protein ligase DOA10